MRVELAHAFAKDIFEPARIAHSAQIDVHEAEMGALEVREERLRRGSLAQISVFPVGDHPDYFDVRSGWLHFVYQPVALFDGISAREVFPGKGQVDDSVFVIGWPIVLVFKGAPGDHRNTE